ncbi:MAG: iron-containing redox enzyme family protein [Alphaproteobacteria bacterium]
MATVIDRHEKLSKTLFRMANEQIVSPEYTRFYDVPLTTGGAAIYILQRAHFVLNRRDCWGHVQGSVPFDVKALIWEHEQDELVGDSGRGLANHYALGVQEGESVGLKPGDFEKTPPLGGVATCCHAWLHIATNRPWLEALASSCMLEIANSDAIVEGGGNAARIAVKMRDELGIGFEEQHSNAEHMLAEIEHAHLLFKVAENHVHTQGDEEAVLRGARDSLAIDRVYKSVLAEAMAAAD